MFVYHYTNLWGLLGIISDRKINLHINGDEFGNLKAVWFSANTVFDTGCGMNITNDAGRFQLNMEVMASTVGLCRFSVLESDTISLADAARRQIISWDVYLRFVESARVAGADGSEWHIALSEFPLDQVVGIECRVGGAWQTATKEHVNALVRQRDAWLAGGGMLPTLDDPSVMAPSITASQPQKVAAF